MLDPIDVVRSFNLSLGIYTLAQAMRPAAVAWWKRCDTDVRFLLLGMLALVAATGWGAAETLATHAPGGTRVLMFTPPLVWSAIGVTLIHRKAHPMKNEPAITIGAVSAGVAAVIALLVAFGVDLTDVQTAAILGVVATVGPLIVAVLTRARVTPTGRRARGRREADSV